MSFEPIDRSSRPLLPGDLEGRLSGWVMHAAGAALASVALAGWLCLATWSTHDPSLTHATGGAVRNWLGPIGAIVSDLLLQTLGFAAVLAFLGFAAAGLELVMSEGLARIKQRLVLFPLAVVALAGALSALPTPATWPLRHGLGGLVGDALEGFATNGLSSLDPALAHLVAGLALFAVGMCLLSSGLALSYRHWLRLLGSSRRMHRVELVSLLSGAAWSLRRLVRPARADYGPATASSLRLLPPAHARLEPVLDVPYRAWPPEAPPPQRLPVIEPTTLEDPTSLPAFLNKLARERPPGAIPLHAESPLHRGLEFDDHTERESRAMAHRFAPAPNTAVAPAPKGKPKLRRGVLPTRAPAQPWRLPALNLLKRVAASRPGPEVAGPVLRGNARLLEDVLADFSIKGEVKAIRPGPVVTLFELEPARGTKAARVIGLADDIARSMSAASARIAPVAGRTTIGIELPNVRREMVQLRELFEAEAWQALDARLPLALGKSIGGESVFADLARMPHLLVAGTTGSGKSVGLNAMILSLLYRLGPSDCRLLMIDPKMLELSVYNGVPHLLAPVITDAAHAAEALRWAVGEMEERMKRMAELGVRNIEGYNERIRTAAKRGEQITRTIQTGFDEATGEPIYERATLDLEPMPYIVVVVDELADLMAVAGKDVESSLQRLAQMARAAGMHLVVATQRPSVDVITGTIKANFPTRIAFRVASKIDSRTIIDEQGAEQLLGSGDMLYSTGAGQTIRVHGPFVSDEEVEKVAAALRQQGEPHFSESLIRVLEAPPDKSQPSGGRTADTEEDMYDRAVAIVHRDQKTSISYLQRRLSIGYNRAADLVERMEREGLVSPPDTAGRRRVSPAIDGGPPMPGRERA